MTAVGAMPTIRGRRQLGRREAELRTLAAELRRVPRQLPPPVPPTLMDLARARGTRNSTHTGE